MSPKYNKIKRYYNSGLWSKVMVRNAVVKGRITAAEYEQITGEAYNDGAED